MGVKMDIRTAILTGGGLIGVNGMAARWGVSRKRVFQYTQMPGFPPAIEVEGLNAFVWPTADVMAWKAARVEEFG
jgi:predicted DNA-binding transcriptional regulator AlpA